MVDLHDPNRYRGRKVANKVNHFLWMVAVAVFCLIGAVIFITVCIPWLSRLWTTVSDTPQAF